MKRAIKFILIFGIICLFLFGIASAEIQTGKCGDNVTWTLLDDGLLIISGTGRMYDYCISIEIEGQVLPPWRAYHNSITQVIIRNGVTHIGCSSFYNCKNLSDVDLPDSLLSIGNNSFVSSGIESIIIPDSVTEMRYDTGWNSYTVELSAFYNCDKLTNVTIGKGLTELCDELFYGCTSLDSIYIPDNIESFGYNTFQSNTMLISSCDSPARQYATQNGNAWELYGNHELACHDSKAATCTEEGYEMYWKCNKCHDLFSDQYGSDSISSPVSIPKVAHIPIVDEAIPSTCIEHGLTEGSHCSVCGETLIEQQEAPLADHSYVVDPAVDATCVSKGLTLGIHCSVCGKILVAQAETPMIDHVIIEADALAPTETEPGRTAGMICSYCKMIFAGQEIPALCDMNVLYLPSSLKSIEAYSLSNLSCQAIIIPNSCEHIGDHAFDGCRNLIYVYIPDTVSDYPQNAFEDCDNILLINH